MRSCGKNQAMRFAAGREQTPFCKIWRSILLCLLALMILFWGCAVVPKTLLIKDIPASFPEDTIISGQSGKPVTFEELLGDLNDQRVIYIGESHTDKHHHDIQLQIIQAIYKTHASMAVGMEMFDHSYQPILDQWSDGQFDQKSFLEKTHWSYNWKFDFDLYSDILNFVKEKQIRLVGLNIPPHIQRKIARGGIESIFGDDKKHLPEKIDLSNTAHRAYVEKVYRRHHHMGALDNFEYFYMAQCVWEEVMAEAIGQNLNEDLMVVLAGNGHIQFKYGIPDRAFRRTGASFRTIYLASVGGEVELGIADYIWVTP
jgi:uncharacterized iron-regulated protein